MFVAESEELCLVAVKNLLGGSTADLGYLCIRAAETTPRASYGPPVEVGPSKRGRRHEAGIRARSRPDYQRCLENAPPNHGKIDPDISPVDFAWCMTALDWGWITQETAARLMKVSSKARENGERYDRRHCSECSSGSGKE